jgi:hypothetical protein
MLCGLVIFENNAIDTRDIIRQYTATGTSVDRLIYKTERERRSTNRKPKNAYDIAELVTSWIFYIQDIYKTTSEADSYIRLVYRAGS